MIVYKEEVKYEIIVGDRFDAFNGEVTKRLKNGWELQGGVSVSITEDDLYIAQAMTKKE